MKISQGKIQKVINEELERALKRRVDGGLLEGTLKNVDINDLMTFAKIYREMSHDLAESFDAMMTGDFDDVFVPVSTMRENLQNIHPEIDEAFSEYAQWAKLNG